MNASQKLTPTVARAARLHRLASLAACLPSMLSAIEFIHPERQEAMMIECGNFADDISAELSSLMREAL